MDTLYKLWLKLGWLLYKVDRLNEKLFDKLVDIGWLRLALYLRSYGTMPLKSKDDFNLFAAAAAYAEYYTERAGHKDNHSINRCYYGLSLFDQVFRYRTMKIVNWFLQPVFKL